MISSGHWINLYLRVILNKNILNLKMLTMKLKMKDEYKSETTNELFGAIGYLASVDLIKNRVIHIV